MASARQRRRTARTRGPANSNMLGTLTSKAHHYRDACVAAGVPSPSLSRFPGSNGNRDVAAAHHAGRHERAAADPDCSRCASGNASAFHRRPRAVGCRHLGARTFAVNESARLHPSCHPPRRRPRRARANRSSGGASPTRWPLGRHDPLPALGAARWCGLSEPAVHTRIRPIPMMLPCA